MVLSRCYTAEYEVGVLARHECCVCEFAEPKRVSLCHARELAGSRASISLDLLRQDNEVIAGLRWSCFAILPPGFYSLLSAFL